MKVLDEQTDSSDLASQIVDVDARLRNLRASETALQAIASQATRIPDVLEVQSRLTEVRGQIEQLAAQQAALADRVALGTLAVTYGTEVVAVTEAARQWDAGREVDAASASLVAFLQQLASAGIWFGIVWLPVLLVAAVLVGVAVLAWRRFRPKIASLNRTQPTYAWGTWAGSQAPAPSGPPPPDAPDAMDKPDAPDAPDPDGQPPDRRG